MGDRDLEGYPIKEKVVPYRFVRYYHGWCGYFGFFWQFVTLIIMFCLIINAINTQAFLLPGFLIFAIVMYSIFILLNIFYFGPYLHTRPIVGVAAKCDTRLTFAIKLARILAFDNDQWHFAVGLGGSAFLLLFYSIFLYNNGLNTFQPIPAIFANTDVMYNTIVKIFQSLVVVLAAILFTIFFESHSDFMFRQLVILNKKVGVNFQSGELPLNNKNLNQAVFQSD